MDKQLLVIINPASGSKSSKAEADEHIFPLLAAQRPPIYYQRQVSKAPLHAGELARRFIASGAGHDVLIVGGDGTIHEVINDVQPELIGDAAKEVTLVVWPSGTANALYQAMFPSNSLPPGLENDIPPEAREKHAWKYTSLLSYLRARSEPSKFISKPLSIACTEIFDKDNAVASRLLAAVVASSSLHAAILHTAEDLRASDPSIERFKVAARQNIGEWSYASVKILDAGEGIELYDHRSRSFVPLPSTYQSSDPPGLKGPFSYFLSTVNVDRLEEKFEVTSPFTSYPPKLGSNSMEIVMLRPERDPMVKGMIQPTDSSSGYSQQTRLLFALGTASQVLSAVYERGSHVALAYPDGQPVVEYFRAGGWEWIPNDQISGNESSKLVCIDGTILKIPAGGKAKCRVLPRDKSTTFSVWVSPATNQRK